MLGRFFLIIILAVILLSYFLIKRSGTNFSSLVSAVKDFKLFPYANTETNKYPKLVILIYTIKNTVLFLTIILFAIMFSSSIIPYGILGDSLTGIFLLIHVTVAPVFSLLLALSFLFYANTHKLIILDFQNLKLKSNKIIFDKSLNLSLIKILFWVICLFSISLLLSIIFTFFPIWGTDGQNLLLSIHAFSGLIITILVILFVTLKVIFKLNSIKNGNN